jgi:citrate lyase subunit beta/citryl-CoA lyase
MTSSIPPSLQQPSMEPTAQQPPLRPRRSVLYMPGSNARALEKAKTLPADAIVFDLEDSVAPGQKEMARSQIRAALENGGYGGRELIVRINGLDTPWAQDDFAAIAPAGPHAVLVPKVNAPGQVMRAGQALTEAGAPAETRVWIMIETPLAVLDIRNIAMTAVDQSSRLAVMVMGVNDIAKATRATIGPGRASLQPVLLQCLLAARAFGLDILDGVFNDFADLDGLSAECALASDLGFDGKTLIHPSQIAAANAYFSPAAADVAEARAIIAAFDLPENASKGAISLDGRMVERLHADIARRTLRMAAAIAALG